MYNTSQYSQNQGNYKPYLNRKARHGIFARFGAVHRVDEAFVTDRWNREVHIVVQELTPLHQHMRVLAVFLDDLSRYQPRGYRTG